MGEEHRTLVTETIRISVLPCAVATDHAFPFLLSSSSVVVFGVNAASRVVCNNNINIFYLLL